MKKVEITDRRYPIGKFEYGQKYKIEDTRKHIRYLAKFPSELKKTVKKLDRDELDSSYRKGGWTVRQVVHHLADSHLNAYIRTKLAVTEQTPIIKPYEEQLWAETEDGKRGSVKMSLKLLAALHRRWMEFLESLSEDDLERGYFHPASGRVMLMQEVIALYVWHSQHHLAHIRLVADGEAEKTEKAAKPAKIEKAKAEKAAPIEDAAPAAKRGTPVNLSRSNIRSTAAPKVAAVPAEGKRVRRTQVQLAAAKAAEAAAKEAKAAEKAVKQAAAAAEKAAKPPVDRKAIMAKARAARQANLAAAGDALADAHKEKKAAAKPAKAAPAAEPGRRIRRTKEQIAADKAAEAVAKAAKPPIDRGAILEKARAARAANKAAALAAEVQLAQEIVPPAALSNKKAAAKPAKPAQTAEPSNRVRRTQEQIAADKAAEAAAKTAAKEAKAAEKAAKQAAANAEKAAKPPVDRAAIMAKARAARQANLAAAGGDAVTPKAKKAADKSAETAEPGKRVRRTQEQIAADKAAKAAKSGDAPKRQGMSAEHMARIRQARMDKRAADIAAGLIPPPQPKVERDPNAPKMSRAEILEKARASRMANIAAKKAEADQA